MVAIQIMSLEDVERIMADTQDAIEYQRVCICILTWQDPLQVHGIIACSISTCDNSVKEGLA